MRIIAGEAKGRTLFAPEGNSTRPTSDKIRGSLFNILGARVIDARVLDLFGGTGALALEALSRGARFALVADNAPAALRCIHRNAENVLKEEINARIRILKADYRTALTSLGDMSFDLVFLDPPYRMTEVYAEVISRLSALDALGGDARIVCERRRNVPVQVPEGFEIFDTRLYGDTAIDFVRRGSPA